MSSEINKMKKFMVAVILINFFAIMFLMFVPFKYVLTGVALIILTAWVFRRS
jgi:hypothetical protein